MKKHDTMQTLVEAVVELVFLIMVFYFLFSLGEQGTAPVINKETPQRCEEAGQ